MYHLLRLRSCLVSDDCRQVVFINLAIFNLSKLLQNRQHTTFWSLHIHTKLSAIIEVNSSASPAIVMRYNKTKSSGIDLVLGSCFFNKLVLNLQLHYLILTVTFKMRLHN